MSCKWLLFLPHHAFCWKATRFNARLQRGCLPVPHRGLCAVTLSVLTPGGGRNEGVRVGFGELGEPAGGLGGVLPPSHLFHFPPCLGLPFLSASLSPSLSLYLAPSLTKLDPRTTGPGPRTGMSQPAYRELPQRSPDTVIEREQRKQGPSKVPF